MEEIPELDASYPLTIEFESVARLLSKINTEPFSMWDFDSEDYGEGLAVENAAELLATGLLFPFEYAYELQKEIGKGADAETRLRTFDFFHVADFFKVPERYVEILVTWSGLSDFVADIHLARET